MCVVHTLDNNGLNPRSGVMPGCVSYLGNNRLNHWSGVIPACGSYSGQEWDGGVMPECGSYSGQQWVKCFVGVGNYIAVFVRNKAFPCCGKTFFANNSCEFDEHARKKTFLLNNVLLTPKTL